MKKVVMLFAFLGVFSLVTQAQSSKKSCAKTCAKTCSKTKTASVISVDDAQIAKLASLDETIERRECVKSGAVSYYKKNTCEVSGKVSFQEVTFDAKEAKFVNVSPKDMGAAAKTDNANTMQMSGTVDNAKKKACASGKKACCASKSKVKASNTTQKIKVQNIEQ